ncbi:MAG: hypothetical protein KatS3mg105_2834 [Gemmatales bacterium]|nr:MAG: hypothetical protein KatS3mg105_2834 [Gemmatales bacterium]
MEQSSGNQARWEGSTLTIAHEASADENGWPLAGPHDPSAFADRLYADESFDPTIESLPPDEGAEPYSLQWFLNIENQRHGRQGRWIPRLMEFSKHAGEQLLGLGNGLGTDWLQYARNGAFMTVCSPSAEQLALIRRNFELRGLGGRFLHADPAHLPLESASIDVACISSLLHEVADPVPVIYEVYRVLKPGGKVLAVTPAKYDVDFWTRIVFPWKRQRQQPLPHARFSARRLKRLFGCFVEHRVHKRQLRRKELPRLWRILPTSVLERLIGRVLVLKAFKPLSSAMQDSLAA